MLVKVSRTALRGLQYRTLSSVKRSHISLFLKLYFKRGEKKTRILFLLRQTFCSLERVIARAYIYHNIFYIFFNKRQGFLHIFQQTTRFLTYFSTNDKVFDIFFNKRQRFLTNTVIIVVCTHMAHINNKISKHT